MGQMAATMPREPEATVALTAPSHAADSTPAADLTEMENEIAALRHRLETAESQIQRRERMLRWTQLMLKHHERLLRRRTHKAVSNG